MAGPRQSTIEKSYNPFLIEPRLDDFEFFSKFYPNNLTPPTQESTWNAKGELIYQGDLNIDDTRNEKLREDIRYMRRLECWHRVGDCFNALVRMGTRNFAGARALLNWEEFAKVYTNAMFDPSLDRLPPGVGLPIVPKRRHAACPACRKSKKFCIHNQDGSVDPDRERKYRERH